MRVALGISYSGARYSGFQRQSDAPSVQEELEKVLSRIADEKIEIACAGRTDAGVSAFGQVIHFDASKKRKETAWTMGVNVFLPPDISVDWCRFVPDDFHARFSALSRTYRYVILNRPLRSALFPEGITHFQFRLDEHLMEEGGQYLLGENDFTSFRSSECQSRTPWRRVDRLTVRRTGDFVVVEIKANAFLHHMVRNIVGSLFLVGMGRKKPEWMRELLLSKDRTLAGMNAPPNGLFLAGVEYPERFGLPGVGDGPLFLSLKDK